MRCAGTVQPPPPPPPPPPPLPPVPTGQQCPYDSHVHKAVVCRVGIIEVFSRPSLLPQAGGTPESADPRRVVPLNLLVRLAVEKALPLGLHVLVVGGELGIDEVVDLIDGEVLAHLLCHGRRALHHTQ